MKKIMIMLLVAFTYIFSANAYASSKVETWKTEEGATVYYLNAPEIPMLDIIVSVDAGSIREGDAYGLASMTANMMTTGTSRLNEEDFLVELDNLQSSISASAGLNSSTFSMRTLTNQSLEPSLSLFNEVLGDAKFDEKIFERDRAQAIDGQKAILDNPGAIANELYYAQLYPNSVIGATSEMLQASLKKLTLEDLNAFRDQYYHANGAKIIFVGDINKEKAAHIANEISNTLGTGEIAQAPEQITPVTLNITKAQYYNSPQTQVMMGQPAIDRFNDDYLPLIIGNHLLGGSGLTSILMTTIREKDGLTYGIYSRFSPSFYEGPFTISFSTKNESVDEAIEKTKAVVTDFINNGPDSELLERAKNNYLGSLVLDLDSNAKLASSILSLATYGLPLDYYEALPEKVRAITPKQVQDAFKQHVNPEEMTTVIVGGYVTDNKSN